MTFERSLTLPPSVISGLTREEKRSDVDKLALNVAHRLAAESGASVRDIRSASRVAAYLFTRAAQEAPEREELVRELQELADDIGVDIANTLTPILDFLTVSEQEELRELARRYATVAANRLAALHFVWNVRPLVRDDHKSIAGNIAMLSLTVHYDDSDRQHHELSVDLSEKDLRGLRNEIDDTLSELDAIKSELGISLVDHD